MTDSISSGGHKARVDHERLLYETRKQAEDIERQSEKSIERQQQRNVVGAGYGGDNTVSFLTGDGDVEGTTGQVTPVLDRPGHGTPAVETVDDMHAMARSAQSDKTAGILLSASSDLDQAGLTPEVSADYRQRLGMHALDLVIADNVPSDVLGRVEGQVGQLQQAMVAQPIDPAAIEGIMMSLDSEFSSNRLELQGEFQKHVHQKLEVLRTLRPLINHMVDDASNGFMGKEWMGHGLQKMMDSYGIDLKLTPEQLTAFTDLVSRMDGNKGEFAGKSVDEERKIFMQNTLDMLLGAMDIDIPIDIQSFTDKAIDVFSKDFDHSAHHSDRGGYKTTAREDALFEQLLVEELGQGAQIAAQHQEAGLQESSKIPRMI
ncbi:hypothetical protein M3P05_14935 [Sansalvadorimonas sp. 2012CJ34-2]|uniref:Uncharacterized protein n=1 Tax=Parendozoicomonas callyspongiae TaxID=2942213 RepID=A0ABT0PIJ9_9GAMM|nr:hypothetical protein [Sansalvadorimonas sp. 2012CJ34-2]MCL6271219.1 hypothetical protein [Sansalvadorimonas sp. 2012CJ34-2]